jgi:hypothetical protein
MNIIETLDDPNLLGASIRDPESWKPWKGLLAAAFGLPLESIPGRAFPPVHGAACAAWRACRVLVACGREKRRKILRHGFDRRVPGGL